MKFFLRSIVNQREIAFWIIHIIFLKFFFLTEILKLHIILKTSIFRTYFSSFCTKSSQEVRWQLSQTKIVLKLHVRVLTRCAENVLSALLFSVMVKGGIFFLSRLTSKFSTCWHVPFYMFLFQFHQLKNEWTYKRHLSFFLFLYLWYMYSYYAVIKSFFKNKQFVLMFLVFFQFLTIF